MISSDDKAFDAFVVRWKGKLRGIARKTQGEQQLEDVVNEAWVMARELSSPDGGPLDLRDEAHQQRLLAHLYQHLVRYTDVTVRHAVRLDHSPSNADGDEVHPLASTLASRDGRAVLDDLVEQEEECAREADLHADGSLAGAYVRLLRHFDLKMERVAQHLRISLSYAYRRCAEARRLATHLRHIPVTSTDALPGPWRAHRFVRAPIQLPLDLGDDLPFG